MNKGELFLRSLSKNIENGKVESTLVGNERTFKVLVDFNCKGILVVANLVFQVTYNPEKSEQTIKESVELFSNKLRKDTDKLVMEMDSFLYHMRMDEAQCDEFEEDRGQLRKAVSFGKREINHLVKNALANLEVEA